MDKELWVQLFSEILHLLLGDEVSRVVIYGCCCCCLPELHIREALPSGHCWACSRDKWPTLGPVLIAIIAIFFLMLAKIRTQYALRSTHTHIYVCNNAKYAICVQNTKTQWFYYTIKTGATVFTSAYPDLVFAVCSSGQPVLFSVPFVHAEEAALATILQPEWLQGYGCR